MELLRGRRDIVKQAEGRKPWGAAGQAEPGGLAGWVLGLLRQRSEGPRAVKNMRVIETLALGGRRQLMLVSCGGERFLVGAGPDRVETIIKVGPAVKPSEEPCS